ncbi:MAG: hypothetical protein ABEJ24_02185 [Candidatus Magasanikbacteria bacterium]
MIKEIINTIKNKFSEEKEKEFLLAGDSKEEEKEILKKVVELSNQDQREVIDEYKEKHVN